MTEYELYMKRFGSSDSKQVLLKKNVTVLWRIKLMTVIVGENVLRYIRIIRTVENLPEVDWLRNVHKFPLYLEAIYFMYIPVTVLTFKSPMIMFTKSNALLWYYCAIFPFCLVIRRFEKCFYKKLHMTMHMAFISDFFL